MLVWSKGNINENCICVDSDRIQSFHMQALRRILGIRWYDKVSNAEVNERTKLSLTDVIHYLVTSVAYRGTHLLRMALQLSIGWLTIVLQCYDSVGWVMWPIKPSPKWPIMCQVDVKLYYTMCIRSDMKFDRQLRPATETSSVVSYGGKPIPRWRTTAILKIDISPYLSEKSSNFEEKNCTQVHILNWMNVTWSNMTKLHW